MKGEDAAAYAEGLVQACIVSLAVGFLLLLTLWSMYVSRRTCCKRRNHAHIFEQVRFGLLLQVLWRRPFPCLLLQAKRYLTIDHIGLVDHTGLKRCATSINDEISFANKAAYCEQPQ